MKLNESKPSEDMSKRLLVAKSIGLQLLIRKTVAVICLLATEQPALRRQEHYTGFYMKRERLTCWCAEVLCRNPDNYIRRLLNRCFTVHTATQSCIMYEIQQASVGLNHSSVDAA